MSPHIPHPPPPHPTPTTTPPPHSYLYPPHPCPLQAQFYWILKLQQAVWPELPWVHIWDYARISFVHSVSVCVGGWVVVVVICHRARMLLAYQLVQIAIIMAIGLYQ